MDPVAKVLVLVDRGHDIRMKVARKGCRKLNSLDSRCRCGSQQTAEGGGAFQAFESGFSFGPIAIDVLADQMNLAVAMIAQFPYLIDYF